MVWKHGPEAARAGKNLGCQRQGWVELAHGLRDYERNLQSARTDGSLLSRLEEPGDITKARVLKTFLLL